MKVAELIEAVSTNKYYSLDSFEDDCDVECVSSDLEVDRHRWYETSTRIYKCEDGFVGVNGVNQLYSESMDYDDCDCKCSAREYIPVYKIHYIPIGV
jgi:hypothetical protein